MHRNSLLIKIQPDPTVRRYSFTAKSLYMFRVSQHPSSGVLTNVAAASGTGRDIGTATCLQRGLIGTGLDQSQSGTLLHLVVFLLTLLYFISFYFQFAYLSLLSSFISLAHFTLCSGLYQFHFVEMNR